MSKTYKASKASQKRIFIYPLILIAFALWVYVVALAFAGEIEIPKAISVGDIQFRFYGIILISSVLISAIVFEKLKNKLAISDKKFKKDVLKFDIYEALIWAIIPGIILGRVFYFVQNATVSGVFPEIYKVWEGGLSIFGGVLGGLLGMLFYLHKLKIKVFPILDLAFITIPLGHAVGRWANFINQEIYGPPTNLPWKMYVLPENKVGIPLEYVGEKFYHPLFLYEFILNLLLFGLLYFLFKQGKQRFNGFYISIYLIGYGVIRFFIEFLRFDPKVFLGLSVAQIISFFGIIASVSFLIVRNFKK